MKLGDEKNAAHRGLELALGMSLTSAHLACRIAASLPGIFLVWSKYSPGKNKR